MVIARQLDPAKFAEYQSALREGREADAARIENDLLSAAQADVSAVSSERRELEDEHREGRTPTRTYKALIALHRQSKEVARDVGALKVAVLHSFRKAPAAGESELDDNLDNRGEPADSDREPGEEANA